MKHHKLDDTSWIHTPGLRAQVELSPMPGEGDDATMSDRSEALWIVELSEIQSLLTLFHHLEKIMIRHIICICIYIHTYK